MRVAHVTPVLTILAIAGLMGADTSAAAEWPADRQFLLAESPEPLHPYPPPSSAAELADGTLLLLLDWPAAERSDDGSGTVQPETRLIRIAPDGTRTFVPRFGNVSDEILPLPDGSILSTASNAIEQVRTDGTVVRFAGTGRNSVTTSGDGGPATAADIGFAHGLTRFTDGSVVFGGDSQVRRVGPDGIITTIAGSGGQDFGVRDGDPATAGRLLGPSDVLPTAGGGFLIAETYAGRVRRVNADGVISTVGGADHGADIYESTGDGAPASGAVFSAPAHLGRLPDGSLVVGGENRIRRIAPNGKISTLFDVARVHGARIGDFAGRYGLTLEAMEVTAEGGIVVLVGGLWLRAYYLAPRGTSRTLVALRDTRASQRRVKATVTSTAAGTLRLSVRQRGRVVARASHKVAAGTHTISVGGRFSPAYHVVRVTLRTRQGRDDDEVRLFTSRTLPERIVLRELGSDIKSCKRMDRRRIDCELRIPEDEEMGPCLEQRAFRLFPSGVLFARDYGEYCYRGSLPFERRPDWTDHWRVWPFL